MRTGTRWCYLDILLLEITRHQQLLSKVPGTDELLCDIQMASSVVELLEIVSLERRKLKTHHLLRVIQILHDFQGDLRYI